MKTSHSQQTPHPPEIVEFYEESSFTLVSNLLTELLGGNCQRILISAKPGSFIHDHTVGVESNETTRLSINSANVTEREHVTEVLIEGAIDKRNGMGNRFSIFFTMKRQFLVIPKPFPKTVFLSDAIDSKSVFDINGMLYNSIFALSLRCIDTSDCQYPLGVGRGYLIFDEAQKV